LCFIRKVTAYFQRYFSYTEPLYTIQGNMRLTLILVLLINLNLFAQNKKASTNPISIRLTKDSTQINQPTDTVYSKNYVDLDTILIKDITPKEENKNEWLKTYLPSIIALFVLFVTNLIVLLKIRIESKEALKRDFTMSSIKLDKERLEHFYDPIFTTLSTNEDIFSNFGPNSFPENEDLMNEASIVWNEMVKNIILPNNKLISDTITTKSHLISKTDSIDNYLNFLKHSQSYAHFIQHPNSMHKNYKYDITFKNKVKSQRDIIVNQLNELEKILNKYGSKKSI
jgi:hypothetical protein